MNHSRKFIALFTLLFTAGCSSTEGVSNSVGNFFRSTEDQPIKIDSEPSGAGVYVMGQKLGVTPLTISRKDVFPLTYPKEEEPQYGKVIIKKDGCLDFAKTISPKIIDAGLHAQLNCGDSTPTSSQTSSDSPCVSETVEQRLDKIKDLLNKGIITGEEAEKARARVLNDL
ncbi:PEGA domain-containing protein [Sideroxydans sp. CL21]|uniref:PEGA domain-containing protein n=1 Tax=Sideroxydans sp. CL21 TaxID=2600596 RepID=UPI0024BC10BD|nr:PEGA domain-containing protein [Sideroxydans sp. CL21]